MASDFVPPAQQPSTAIVVMGVSGCGKSTLARALADRLGRPFIEGDNLHGTANRAKMAAGNPLTDADREPWLASVGEALAAAALVGGGVAACSALRRRYRDLLRERAGPIVFIHPMLDVPALHERLAARRGHFMPTALLQSQCDTLEPPQPDETSMLVDGLLAPDEQLGLVLERWREIDRDGHPVVHQTGPDRPK